MVRTQYITIEELNEILGVSTYTDDDLVKVYEASEVIEYNLFNPMAKFDTLNAPKEIKLATLQKMFAAEGSVIPNDESVKDYIVMIKFNRKSLLGIALGGGNTSCRRIYRI